MTDNKDLNNILFSVGYVCSGSKYYLIKKLYVENYLRRFILILSYLSYFDSIEKLFPEIIESLDFRDKAKLKILLKKTKDGYDYRWSKLW